MISGKIPRAQWIRFFDDFSKGHEGWITTVEVIGMEVGDQVEASALPLVGISADQKDRENRIEVTVGANPETYLTHVIDNPQRVELKPPGEDGHEVLAVESEDGTTTLVSISRLTPEPVERQLPS